VPTRIGWGFFWASGKQVLGFESQSCKAPVLYTSGKPNELDEAKNLAASRGCGAFACFDQTSHGQLADGRQAAFLRLENCRRRVFSHREPAAASVDAASQSRVSLPSGGARRARLIDALRYWPSLTTSLAITVALFGSGWHAECGFHDSCATG
jgi:hypothetical protein